MPECNKVPSATSLDGSKLLLLSMGALLLSALLATELAAQANDPAASAPAQEPTPSTQSAQPEQAQTTQPARTRSTRRRPTLDDQVKTLAASLNLNETQQIAVKHILEQRQREILRIRQDPSIPGSDRISRLRALQDQTVQRIRSVLDDEQKKKYDPLAVRRVGQAPDQKSVEDWLKVTTPKK